MKIILFTLTFLFSLGASAHSLDHHHSRYESRDERMELREHKFHHSKGHKKMHRLHDGQIGYILSKSNKAEVEVADAIKHRLKNGEVKDFAKMMIKEHSTAEKKFCKMMDKEGILKSPNKFGLKLDKKKEHLIYHLRQYSKSSELDRAYIKSQIKVHEMMLEGLDEKFIPSADSDTFRNALYDKRESVARHLSIAKSILSRLP